MGLFRPGSTSFRYLIWRIWRDLLRGRLMPGGSCWFPLGPIRPIFPRAWCVSFCFRAFPKPVARGMCDDQAGHRRKRPRCPRTPSEPKTTVGRNGAAPCATGSKVRRAEIDMRPDSQHQGLSAGTLRSAKRTFEERRDASRCLYMITNSRRLTHVALNVCAQHAGNYSKTRL